MSRALSSDAEAAGGPRLWWLTDSGEVRSSRGVLCPLADAGPWAGIAARADRLLLWTARELHLVDVRQQTSRLVLSETRSDIDRAGWAADEDKVVEVYSHEVTGHPTDRGGHRTRLELNTMQQVTLAHRQGIAPPWGSRGAVTRHGDVCSGPAGVVYKEWHEGAYRLWWSRAGRGGRRRLPDALVPFGQYRLLSEGGVSFVCAFLGRTLAICDVSGERAVEQRSAPADIYDAALHGGALFLAMSGRDPERVMLTAP